MLLTGGKHVIEVLEGVTEIMTFKNKLEKIIMKIILSNVDVSTMSYIS